MNEQLKDMEKSFFEQLKLEIDLNKVKDELFQLFCQRLKEARTKLREAESLRQTVSRGVYNTLGLRYASPFEQNVLNCLEEKWTFLIKDLEDYMRDKVGQGINIKESEEYKRVFNYVNVHESSFFDIDIVKDFVSSTFFATQIGFYFLTVRDDLKQSQEYFELAIKLDERHCVGAHVGIACCKIKSEKNLKGKNEIRENKKSTFDEMCKALRLVYAHNNVVEYELSQFNDSSIVSRLYNNLNEKLLILKVFASALESNIETIRNSQCLMNLTVVHDEENATRVENLDNLEYAFDKIKRETSKLG
jgi:hypothetical protein